MDAFRSSSCLVATFSLYFIQLFCSFAIRIVKCTKSIFMYLATSDYYVCCKSCFPYKNCPRPPLDVKQKERKEYSPFNFDTEANTGIKVLFVAHSNQTFTMDPMGFFFVRC